MEMYMHAKNKIKNEVFSYNNLQQSSAAQISTF